MELVFYVQKQALYSRTADCADSFFDRLLRHRYGTQRETPRGTRRGNLQTREALFDKAVEGRIDNVLELGDIGLVDDHARLKTFEAWSFGLVGIKRLGNHRLVRERGGG